MELCQGLSPQKAPRDASIISGTTWEGGPCGSRAVCPLQGLVHFLALVPCLITSASLSFWPAQRWLLGLQEKGTGRGLPCPSYPECPYLASLDAGSGSQLNRPDVSPRAVPWWLSVCLSVCLLPPPLAIEGRTRACSRPHSHPQMFTSANTTWASLSAPAGLGGLCCVCILGKRYRENPEEHLMGSR